MLKHSLMAMAALGLITLSAAAGNKVIDIDAKVQNAERVAKEDLGTKKVVTEAELGLRKTDLYKEAADTEGVQAKFDAPAPGSGTRYERAYVNAPPMIPHSVDGLLPITKSNNACLGCHMPAVAASVKATPIPPSHFTNFRPETVMKDGKVVKEGKVVGPKGDIGNVGDIKLAKVKKLKDLYQGRFNCSQCHAPQANIDAAVGNTFKPDFGKDDALKAKSNLIDVMNEGVE